MIKDLKSLKLYNAFALNPVLPVPIYKTIITINDMGYAMDLFRRNNPYLAVDNYGLELVEELKPTTPNMIGLAYFNYLNKRESEQRYNGIKPMYFENVLDFGNQHSLDVNWFNFVHVSDNRIRFTDIVNEERDRDVVMEFARIDLEKRKEFNTKEKIRLEALEKNLNNIDIIPLSN
jgi:hypothetical protein